jgi:cytoskeletal protein RodZ
MLERKRIAAIGCLGILTLAGCGQSGSEPRTSTSATSAKESADSPQESSPVRVASAETPAAAEETAPAATAETEAAPATDATQQEPATLAPAAAIPLDEAPESQLAMPKVSLSDAHAALCKVKVGDQCHG